MYDVLASIGSNELLSREKKAKKELQKSLQSLKDFGKNPLIRELEKKTRTPLEWTSTIEEEFDFFSKYEDERSKAILLYKLAICSYTAEIDKIDKEKTWFYVNNIAKQNDVVTLRMDIEKTLNDIDKNTLKEWLISPELNKGKYESLFIGSIFEDKITIKYGKKEVDIFLDSVLKPIHEAIEKIKDNEDIKKYFKKSVACKEKELLIDDSIDVDRQDVLYIYNGEIDKNVKTATQLKPITVELAENSISKEYPSSNNIIVSVKNKNGTEVESLDKIDYYLFEIIQEKVKSIFDEIFSLKEKDIPLYFSREENFCVSIPMKDYANTYGRNFETDSSKDKIRKEMVASLDRLQTLSIKIEDKVFLEEMGIDTNEIDMISFNLIEGYDRPTIKSKTSCFNVYLASKYFKASLCKANGIVVLSKNKNKPPKLQTTNLSLEPRQKLTEKDKYRLIVLYDKLRSNYLIGNNLKNGQKNKLSSKSIMLELEDKGALIPMNDKENAYFSRWGRYQKKVLENMLDKLVEEKLLKSWHYEIYGVKTKRDEVNITYQEWRPKDKDKCHVIIWYELEDKNGKIKKQQKKTVKKMDNINTAKQKSIKRNMEKAKQKANDRV